MKILKDLFVTDICVNTTERHSRQRRLNTNQSLITIAWYLHAYLSVKIIT